MKNNNLIAILFAFTLLNTAAQAEFGVGVSTGIFNIEADATETTGAGNTGTSDTHSHSMDNNPVFIPSIFAEYSMPAFYTTVGLEFTPGSADVSSKNLSRHDTPLSGENTGVSLDKSANASVSNLRTGYIEVGNSFYARLGYSVVDVKTKEANVKAYGDVDALEGINYGLGYKGDAGSLFYKVSYEMTDFDTLSISSASDNKVKADIDTAGAKLAIGFNF